MADYWTYLQVETVLVGFALLVFLAGYTLLHLLAPKPRLPFPSEKTYITTNPDGTISAPRKLPCWHDRWLAEQRLTEKSKRNKTDKQPSGSDVPDGFPVPENDTGAIEPAEVEISVVIPAYNEADRILPTLEEMVEYLDQKFGRPNTKNEKVATQHHRLVFRKGEAGKDGEKGKSVGGYEIIIVNDGSKDKTVEVALEFSAKHGLHDILRVVTLEKNRGKGGGVTHGFRHVRGKYIVFADADGASRFSDLGKLIEGCEDVVDGSNRGVAIGSRAHLVGSEAVVKVTIA